MRKKNTPRPATVALAPPPMRRRPSDGTALWPVAIDQERLWFLYQLAPEDTSYNVDGSVLLRGPVRPEVLEASLTEIVRRHESWRTSFPSVDGRPVQRIEPPAPAFLPVIDLSGLSAPRLEEEARRVATATVHTPFDITAAPPLRWRLIRVGEQDWVLAIGVHHIISDWVSFQLFLQEVGVLYQAFGEGRPSPLPELPLQYADFAVWQRDWLKDEVLEAHLDYWRQQLAGAPLMIDLPIDKPRPLHYSTHGAKVLLALSKGESDRLRALAQSERVTPFMALLALYQTLLHHLSRQDKVLVASPNTNRNRVELERLMGFFITQLVFPTDLSGDPTFRETLGRVRQTALGAYAHQDLPFGKLVEGLRPERDTSRPPIAQVQLNLLAAGNQGGGYPRIGPVETQPVAVEHDKAQLELSVAFWDSPDGFSGWLEYNTDLFETPTALRIVESFHSLVRGVFADPDRPLSALPLWPEAARHQVLVEWNDTARAVPAAGLPDTVHGRFEAQARRTPDAVAVVHDGLRITYAELERRANQLARTLRRLGVGQESRVGVCLDRNPDLLATLLGIWKAGGAYVPLDPAYPRERLEFMLEDSGAAVLVSRETLALSPALALRPSRAQLLLLDRDAALIEREDGASPPGAGAGHGNLAYAIYTSGSTGRPKAVGIEQRAALAFVEWAVAVSPAGAAEAILGSTSVCFDLSVFELFTPLTVGGRVVLAENALALPALSEAGEVTLLNTVPSALAELLRLGNLPPSVRTINLCGEALSGRLARDAYAQPTVEALYNLYGPSEDTVYSTVFRVSPGADREPGARPYADPPIGRAIAGTRVYVLDRHGLPVPVGVAGELVLAGAGLARGYLGRPDITAERFVPDPFAGIAGEPGGRVYRTGDLVRWLAEGELAFLGRIDYQVKVRGFRVEMGEIEAELTRHPAVHEAAVRALPIPGSDGKRLAAYVSPKEGTAADPNLPATLRAFLQESLPDFMVPSLWTVLPALPHTPNGKIDRKALPAPEAQESTTAYVAPRTSAEEALAGVWSALLGARRVGVHDNFFQLGGDSILGIQVVSRARQAGLVLTPKQIFQYQTVAELATVAEPVTAGHEEDAGPAEGEAPLTPIQRWFLDETAEMAADARAIHHYNQDVFLETRALPGPLARAAAALTVHHDALRLRFARGEEGWRQRFAPISEVPSPWAAIDLSALPEEAGRGALEAATAALQASFDIGRGPLFRAAYFDLGGSARLHLIAHHLVIDGVSWRTLLEDLTSAYAQAAAGSEIALPARTTSWQRWARRLAEHARSEAVRAELDFWRSLPAPSPLPADFPLGPGGPDGPETEAFAEQVRVRISPEATRALLQEAQEPYRTRINDLLLAALARAVARWSGSPGLVVDLESHGREDLFPGVDLSRTVGWFTSLFPVALEAGEDLAESILGAKEALRAVPGNGLGYGLLRYLNPETRARLAARPDPEVVFNYLGQLDQVLGADGLFRLAPESAGPVHGPHLPRRHRIEVSSAVLDGGLGAAFLFSRGIHRRESIQRLADAFVEELAAVVEHCSRPEAGRLSPSDFPLARLDATLLDRLSRSDGRGGRSIVDVYPLSPLQEGLLFHALYAPGTEIYFEQMNAAFRGDLDAAAFRRAWQGLVDRHAVLRTSFVWEDLDEPLQVVHRDVTLPWTEEDWRRADGSPADPAELDARFAAWLEADRRRGFELGRPPLTRAALIRTGDREYRFVWSFHHLLLDGWCLPILVREMLEGYRWEMAGPGATPPPRPPALPYRDYIAWLQARDLREEEAYWRRTLAGIQAATPLPFDHPEEPGVPERTADYRQLRLALPEEETAALEAFARGNGLTLNTLVQGAWGLLLSRWSGEPSVVFGAVVSGRPPELPGIESAIGCFINTLPVRVDANPADLPVVAWLRRLQESQAELRQHEGCSLAQVQRWSSAPARQPLFQSLLVFENYPLGEAAAGQEPAGGLDVVTVEASERTHYPLSLLVSPGRQLKLQLTHNRRFEEATVRRIQGHLLQLLAGFASASQPTVGSMAAALELPDRLAAPVAEAAPASPERPALNPTDLKRLSPEQLKALLARKLLKDKKAREETRPAVAAADELPLEPVPRTGEPFPLSFSQERLWFLSQLDAGGASYNIPVAVVIPGEVVQPKLEAAFNGMVRRHEALRTVFETVDGAPRQRILPELRISLPCADLRPLPEPARSREAKRLGEEQGMRPFDLTRAPLLEALLIRLADGDTRLHVTLHHIVADGWSMGLFVRELIALYFAFLRGEPSPLPELPIQYADFAVWQRQRLSGDALEGLLAGWRKQLAGAPELLDLPTDHPHPPVQTFHGGGVDLRVDALTTAGLRAVTKGAGATLFMTLLAAYHALLHRWTGQEDIVVGSPVAGRSREKLENLIGVFINMLTLRGRLEGDPSFRELLDRVKADAFEAYRLQDLPFERLVEELQPARVMARPPVFQVTFGVQNAPSGAGELQTLQIRVLPVEVDTAKFELTLTCTEYAAGLLAALDYNSEIFDRTTAQRFLDQLGRVFTAVARDPNQRLSELPLLGEGESAQLLREWNDTAFDLSEDGNRCLHELVEAQVDRTPDAVALLFEGETMSYGELERRANLLAHRLRAMGVGPEVRVALCVERSFDLLVGILGVLKAGGAYVPVDADYPRERLAFMLEDSRAVALLTQRRLAASLPVEGRPAVFLDDPAELADWPETRPAGNASSDNLAYVIYTSGSTGRPKGVMAHHRGVVNRILWAQRAYPVGPEDRAIQKGSYSFDFSVWECLGPLMAGASVVLARPGGQRDPLYLARTVAEQGVTLLHFVPSMLGAYLAEPEAGRPSRLRLVVTGGEALTPELRDRFDAVLPPGAVLNNQYGPTEVSIDVTEHRIPRGEPAHGPVPMGRPLSNAAIRLLDRHFRPVPIGVPGELMVGGVPVTRGYLERPDLTAERYVPDPFGEPGARLYRTGDLVKWLADGELLFLGRVDHQVKVRGFRIELGEIESALRAHPGLADAAVLARGQDADRRLVAYVVPRDGSAAPDPAALRDFLRGHLPDYMVPALYVPLPALPISPNGKLDRKALPEPEAGAAQSEYTAPRSPLEELIAGVWSEVLGRERVGIYDDFFALGGHSLLATRVVSRLRDALGVEVDLRRMFEQPSVAGLARLVGGDGGKLAAAPIVPVPRDGDLPLSFAQQRLWFLDQLEPGSAAYNIPSGVRLSGDLSVPALAASLEEVVRRHEALRTTFAEVNGEAVQRIGPPRVKLPLVDLSGLPDPHAAERRLAETEGRRLAAADAVRPFDLARGPLLRTALLRLAEREHALLFTVHHVVSDGWSAGVMVREIAALYPAFLAGRPSPLPPLPVQYADFASWQRRTLSGDVLEAHLSAWRERLAGAPPVLELPTDRPRPARQTGERGDVDGVLLPPGPAAEALAALARRQGATPFMTLLAAWKTLLHRHTGETDLVVGTPTAGRNRAEIEGLIGFFVNTLVLRTDLGGDPSFAELVGRVREGTLAAYAHQDLPFERLVEELAPERSLAHTPLFQVMFILQNATSTAAAGATELPGLTLAPFGGGEGDGPAAKFDLTLSVGELGGAGLAAGIGFNRDLFDAPSVERLLRQLRILIGGAAAEPGRRLSELPVFTEEERAQVFAAQVPASLPQRLAHHRIADWVERTPDALAVAAPDGTLTFAELDRRAAALAARLRELGVGPEIRVGLCPGRTTGLLVGILGVWKAGGAWVPLDPSHPRERIAFVLQDAGAAALVTERGLLGDLPPEARAVYLDDLADGPAPPLADGLSPAHAAYVLYTSGSTGQPKGAVIEHASLSNYLAWVEEELLGGLELPAITSLAFDASLKQLLGPLLSGRPARVLPEEAAARPAVLLAELASGGYGALNGVPSLWNALLELVENGEAPAPVTLRRLLLGGEPVETTLLARTAAVLPGLEVVNLYGPTEATANATAGRVSADQPVTLGRPLPNTGARVLGRHGEPAPVGAFGELCLTGAGLARGYLGRPDLTAERFLPDPWSAVPGGRLYRTGDRVCLREPGGFEFRGRVDHQVKVRGFRVELGEIEALLAAHPAVREAAVVVRGSGNDLRLAAWIAPRESAPNPLSPVLRTYLKERLPAPMVPAELAVVEALPRTATGKVDRRALAHRDPAPDREDAERLRPYVAPQGPVEEQIAAIWSELLGVEKAGRADNFFELGGHSLLATRLASRIRRTFGVELPLRTLFEVPDLEALAQAVLALQLSRKDQEELAGMMAELDDLSEEEVLALLAAEEAAEENPAGGR